MSYVYIIRSGENGPYKIGYSNNPDYRIEILQVGNPEKLYKIAAIDFKTEKRAQTVERQLHKMYSRAKIRGEWFRSDIELKRADDFFNTDCQKMTGFDEQKQEIIELEADAYLDVDLLKSCPF